MRSDNLFAFAIFIITAFGFFVWGYQYIPTHHFLLFSIASIFGIFMAFNIGGNDVARYIQAWHQQDFPYSLMKELGPPASFADLLKMSTVERM